MYNFSYPLLNLLNKLTTSSIVSILPFSKSREIQVYKCFSNIKLDKLFTEFSIADNCSKINLSELNSENKIYNILKDSL